MGAEERREAITELVLMAVHLPSKHDLFRPLTALGPVMPHSVHTGYGAPLGLMTFDLSFLTNLRLTPRPNFQGLRKVECLP